MSIDVGDIIERQHLASIIAKHLFLFLYISLQLVLARQEFLTR